jgi:hypothetical protein
VSDYPIFHSNDGILLRVLLCNYLNAPNLLVADGWNKSSRKGMDLSELLSSCNGLRISCKDGLLAILVDLLYRLGGLYHLCHLGIVDNLRFLGLWAVEGQDSRIGSCSFIENGDSNSGGIVSHLDEDNA